MVFSLPIYRDERARRLASLLPLAIQFLPNPVSLPTGLSSFLAITACHHTVDLWRPAPLTSSDGMNGIPVLWYLSTLQQEVVYYISI
jgi:hypothetical protein